MQVLDIVQLKIKHQFKEKYNFVEASSSCDKQSVKKKKRYLP